jgi:hypothetical protein
MEKAAPALQSELVRAARALLRWEQRDLANASSVSLPTIKRLESKPGGIVFINENGGGAGVRFRRRHKKKV